MDLKFANAEVMRTCRRCAASKAIECFRWQPNKANTNRYLTSVCIECDNSRRRRAHRANPEQSKWTTIKKKYDLTKEQYETLWAQQEERCAVYGCVSSNWDRGWIVDHSHNTGKVRGIVCTNCNLLLGHAKDDAERLRAAANYLEKHK